MSKPLVEFFISSHISAVWPLLVLPLAAAWVSDRAARTLPPTRADWRVAAALAGFPGLIMLMLCAMSIGRALFHPHQGDWGHAVQYQLLPAVALGILGYGIVRAWQRNRAVTSLTDQAVPAGPRLRAAAASLGLEAAELPVRDCECFVAGFWKPRIFVSSGAAEMLSDAELRAALCHERAHASGFDPAFLTILTFLRDIAPGSSRALDAYRQARERFADQEAVRANGSIAVASALLAVARQAGRPVYGVSMASSCASGWRFEAILGLEKPSPALRSSRLFVAAGLALDAGFAAWPVLQVYLTYVFLCGCTATPIG